MDTLEFCWFTRESPLFAKAKAVRQAVFVEEQGFSPVGEVDAIDETCQHLLVTQGGSAVGVARLYPEASSVLHLGRVALLAKCRGRGMGLLLMEEVCKKVREMGAHSLVLSAQTDKVGFYEKAGFSPTGHTSMEEGCPHVEMHRRLAG